jgi:hypothetical protein
MKYDYAEEYTYNPDYARAVNEIAVNLGHTPSNVIILSSMKNLSFHDLILVSKESLETQQLALAPIFTDAVNLLRTVDLLFSIGSKIEVMNTLANDMHRGKLLTDDEFSLATKAINEISIDRGIIDIIEDCEVICKMLRKFELGHVELFATAKFDSSNVMIVDAGIRCIDPIEVFFSNLDKIANDQQSLVMSMILKKMKIDKKLTKQEAIEMEFCFNQSIRPSDEVVEKFATLLREDYVFLYEEGSEMKIGFAKVGNKA